MKITLPYGKTHQELTIPDGIDAEILRSKAGEMKASGDEDQIVIDAMRAPIGSPSLAELAKGRKTAVIICSDHTRPVPSRRIIPHMLKELRDGNPAIDITLLIATGFHRLSTIEELEAKFGPEIVRSEKIKVHNSRDESSLVELGVLPSGAKLIINKTAAEADLLISEGFIEPHFFAGFSGGRKSVLPGISGYETVLGNHCSEFIGSPKAKTGILEGNPIHRDMLAAAKMANLQYIVNVIIDPDKKVIAAVAGDPFAAHAAGCDILRKFCVARATRAADISITTNGGAPLDQNIYQTVKGLTAGEAVTKEGGVIIACSACADGSGGDGFYHSFKDSESPKALLAAIESVPRDKTKPDQWESQILARILSRFEVILVCEPETRKIAEEMKIQTAGSVQEAFEMACRKIPNPSVTVIPDGVSVIASVDRA